MWIIFASLLRIDVLQDSHFTINGDAPPGSLGKGQRGCEAGGTDACAPNSQAVWQNLACADVSFGLCQFLDHALSQSKHMWRRAFCSFLKVLAQNSHAHLSF